MGFISPDSLVQARLGELVTWAPLTRSSCLPTDSFCQLPSLGWEDILAPVQMCMW